MATTFTRRERSWLWQRVHGFIVFIYCTKDKLWSPTWKLTDPSITPTSSRCNPWSHYPGKNSFVRIPPHLECMLVFIFHSVRASIMWAWHYFLPQHINHTHFPVLALENIIGRMSFGAESSSMNVSDRYRQVGGISTENLMKWRLRRPDTAQVSRQLRGIRWQVLESMLKTFSGQVRDGRVIVSRIYIVCTRRQTKMVQLPPWQ